MTANRLIHDMVDERILQLQENLDKLIRWRYILEDFEFHTCKKHETMYGIHKGDANMCKMCKREGAMDT